MAAVLHRSRPDQRCLPVRRRQRPPIVHVVRRCGRMLAGALAELAPGRRWADLCCRPPDAFAALALTSVRETSTEACEETAERARRQLAAGERSHQQGGRVS